jgi:hypothetical protein
MDERSAGSKSCVLGSGSLSTRWQLQIHCVCGLVRLKTGIVPWLLKQL